jgi:(p)ppGpp synthase/HD superfamily hydrolase
MATLERAIALAATYHTGQEQKNGQPYILHPLHVMQQVTGLHAKMVAVLHDTIEDTDMTPAMLTREGFPSEVILAVDLLTRKDGQPYDDYLAALAGNTLALTVKIADVRHNLDSTRLDSLSDHDVLNIRKYHAALRWLLQQTPTS